jgi:hypothetical protein
VDGLVRVAMAGSSRDRVLVAIIVGLLVVFFGPAMCTLRYPAPIGRTIWGVTRRLDRDLPKGTSMDSAVAYLNRVGIVEVTTLDPTFKGRVWYMINSSHDIEGVEEGVATQWPLEGDLIFHIYFDNDKRVVRDTVYGEVIFP